MRAWALIGAAALGSSGAASAEPTWIHGFVQGETAYRATPADSCPDTQRAACEADFVREAGRLQLEVAPQWARWGLLGKADLVYDGGGGVTVDLREAYVDVQLPAIDLRVGRQILTWGVGDLIFITDVFPKDRNALISGLPVEYFKKGSDAVNATVHVADSALQLVVIPRFEADTVPQPGGRLMFNDPFAAIPTRHTDEPPAALDNVEAGLRLARNVGGWDVALSAYRGFFHTPSGQVEPGPQLRLFYPRLDVYGATAQAPAWGGVVSMEAGYYDSRDDRSGMAPAIENSSFRGLLGYQRELIPDLVLSAQYHMKLMQDHDEYLMTVPPGMPRRPLTRQLVAVRLTRLLLNQTLKVGIYVQGSPNEHDFFVNPEVKYSVTDAISSALGVNLFLGPGTTELGQFQSDSNLYFVVRYAL